MYRIPARRRPYRDRRDGFTSQLTPGGVALQSPPQWSPPSPEQPDPYNSPALSDCSDTHLPNNLEKSIQAQIDALERAKALILARKNGSSSNTQSPILSSPNPPYNIAINSPVIPINSPAIPITTEYLRPRGPMQPIYPGDPDYPDYPEDPNCHDNITTEDYEPETIPLDFSRYELPEEFEEFYQRPRGPMQPILTDPDAESRISSDVSDQLAIPSEIVAQFRDDKEITTTTAPVEVDGFFNDFSNDIFEYEIESTQSSDGTPSSPVETRPMTRYEGAPEAQDTPPSLIPGSKTSLSFPPPSLSLPYLSLSSPSPSLPRPSEQKLSPMSQTQSFLRSFITSASLFSRTPKLLLYSRPQLSEFTVAGRKITSELGIDIEDLTDIANRSDQVANCSNRVANRSEPNETKMFSPEATEPVEWLSVLAEILGDYEESNDTPVALRPNRSPFLPSMALDVATFDSFSADDPVALESPRATIVALSEEFPPGERSLPRESKSLASLLPISDYSTSADPWSSPLSPLPPSLPPVEQSPFTVALLFSASPVPPSVTPTSPLHSPDELSPDVGSACQNSPPTKLAAPGPSDETSVRVAKIKEKVATPETISSAPSPSRVVADPSSSTKYRAPAHKAFPRSEAPATRCNRSLTAPTTNPEVSPRIDTVLLPRGPRRCCLDLSPALFGPCTVCRPLFNAVFWDPLIPWVFSLSDNGTLAPEPTALSPPSRSRQLTSRVVGTPSLSVAICQFQSSSRSPSPDSLAVVIGPCQFRQSCHRLESVESPKTRSLRREDPGVLDLFKIVVGSHHGSPLTSISLLGEPHQRLGPSPRFSGSRPTARLFSLEATFQALLAHRLISFFSDETPNLLPVTLPPSSRSRQLALGILRTLSPSLATHRSQSAFQSPSPGSPAVVIKIYWSPRDRNQSEHAGSSGTRPLCRSNFDVLGILDVLDVLNGAPLPVPAWQVPTPRVSLTWVCGLLFFHWSLVSVLSLFVVYFFSLLVNSLRRLVVSRLLASQTVCMMALLVSLTSLVARLLPYVTSWRFFESRVYFFPSLCSCFTSLDFPRIFFPLVVFVVLLFSPHFPNRGRSVFKAPRRGNRSLRSTSQVPGPTTHLSSPSHKATSSTPHITPCSLAISPGWSRQSEPSIVTKGRANDTGPALVVTQPRLTKRFRHGHVGPEFSDHFAGVSRRFPDEVVPLRNHSNHTEHPLPRMTTNPLECTKTSLLKDQLLDGQDIPQHPDHRSTLPSPGRPRLFRRSSVNTCRAGVTLMIPTLPDFAVTSLLRIGPSARDLRPKGSDDDGTGREGFPISCCDPENIEHSPVTIGTYSPTPEEGPLDHYEVLFDYKFPNQEGTHQPGMVGI